MARIMNTSILITLILLLNMLQLYPQGFTVSGTKLLDANGKEFIIRGVNNPHSWYQSKAYKALDRIAGLNVNTIRIVWQTKGDSKELEKIITRCIKLEMIPMVELHDATGNNTTEKLVEMAEYYTRSDVKEVLLKFNRYILINIANEWGDYFVTTEHWKTSYKQTLDTLRKAGYKTTIVIDAPNWGQNLNPVLECGNELQEYDPQHNILFSIHMYYFWNDPKKIVSELQAAHDLSIPLIVGEFGYNYNNGDNNLKCQVDHKVVLHECNDLGYGYMPWSWAGNDEINAWLDLTSDWKNLTWWGKEVFEGENGIIKTGKKASIFSNNGKD
jgi:mannan endo-1,4-beta-mannosidase